MSAPLILASASPRRVELLQSLEIDFEVIPSEATELHDHSMPVGELCELNAVRKAEFLARRFPDRWVLGADTLVTRGGKVFGKPGNLAEAEQMLAELQGRVHQVITGVSLQKIGAGVAQQFHEVTEVRFKSLTREEIREYMGRVHVLDKAGAYAIQEHGEMIVEGISGSYSNVVGLPLEMVRSRLEEIGILARR